jgi:parvulin-like peptidyl-prolyl cis-trans isomerase-like protein
MNKIFRQPLMHFLILGLSLFGFYEWVGDKSDTTENPRTIVVDRDVLLTFMQYRSKAFNKGRFGQLLDNMREEERQQLINDLVREEVLYREALSLRLNENDYVVKRRLIQKLEFITKGFIDSATELTGDQINSYFEEHKAEYYIQPSATFTHVFFDKERHGGDKAKAMAEKKLVELKKNKVSFSEAISHGDRFLYHTNYVERVPDYVSSHFGKSMTQAIFENNSNHQEWIGPFDSPYGFHIVLVTQKKDGRLSKIKEIYDRVKDDAQRDFIRKQTESAIQKIINSYNVEMAF